MLRLSRVDTVDSHEVDGCPAHLCEPLKGVVHGPGVTCELTRSCCVGSPLGPHFHATPDPARRRNEAGGHPNNIIYARGRLKEPTILVSKDRTQLCLMTPPRAYI